MAARLPNVLNGAIELGFVIAAGVLGFMHAPLWSAPALAAAMIAYWAFNRRAGLATAREQGFARLSGLIAVSVALMTVFLGGAYWIGHALGNGNT